jgi:hypothetical protein
MMVVDAGKQKMKEKVARIILVDSARIKFILKSNCYLKLTSYSSGSQLEDVVTQATISADTSC